MQADVAADVIDGLGTGLLMCGFQIAIGVVGFLTYRREVGSEESQPKGPSPMVRPREEWSRAVTGLALLQYFLVCFCTVAVVPLAFAFANGWLALLWVALIVYFALLGMMTAVMFPTVAWRAVLHVATPFVYAALVHLVRGDELPMSLWSQALLAGIYYGTVIPIMLAVLFLQVGWKAVRGGAAVVNLVMIGALVFFPIRLWTVVAPEVAGDHVGTWVVLALTTVATLAQYVAAWHAHVRPLVAAGKV